MCIARFVIVRYAPTRPEGHDLPSASSVARRRRIFSLIRLLLAPWLRTEALCRNVQPIPLRALNSGQISSMASSKVISRTSRALANTMLARIGLRHFLLDFPPPPAKIPKPARKPVPASTGGAFPGRRCLKSLFAENRVKLFLFRKEPPVAEVLNSKLEILNETVGIA